MRTPSAARGTKAPLAAIVRSSQASKDQCLMPLSGPYLKIGDKKRDDGCALRRKKEGGLYPRPGERRARLSEWHSPPAFWPHTPDLHFPLLISIGLRQTKFVDRSENKLHRRRLSPSFLGHVGGKDSSQKTASGPDLLPLHKPGFGFAGRRK